MWHNEIRSLAPRILPYERAVLANAVAPASRADLVKNFLRSMVPSGALMLVLLDQFQMPLGRPNHARTTGSGPMRRLRLKHRVLLKKITVIGPEEWILGEWSAI